MIPASPLDRMGAAKRVRNTPRAPLCATPRAGGAKINLTIPSREIEMGKLRRKAGKGGVLWQREK